MNLAANANAALYASMIVYTLAMLAFTWHLAARAPKVADSKVAEVPANERESVLVGAGAPTTTERRPATPYTAGPGFEESLKSRQRGSIALMLTYLASALLVSSVLMRGLAVGRPPWGNMFEFATAAAAAVGAAYSVLAKRNNWQWLGVFIVAPILLVLGLALTVLYTEAGELMPALKSYWLGIHVSVAFLAVAFFTLAFARRPALPRAPAPRGEAAGQAQLHRVAAVRPQSLERTAYSLNMVAFILWTFTLIAGAIWAKQAWGSYWQWDPKEVWTFVIWTVYAAYMHSRATAGVDHRKSMYIALVGYVSRHHQLHAGQPRVDLRGHAQLLGHGLTVS